LEKIRNEKFVEKLQIFEEEINHLFVIYKWLKICEIKFSTYPEDIPGYCDISMMKLEKYKYVIKNLLKK
jgi:hypothetical protein